MTLAQAALELDKKLRGHEWYQCTGTTHNSIIVYTTYLAPESFRKQVLFCDWPVSYIKIGKLRPL